MPNWSLLGAMILPNIGGWGGALTMVGQVKKPDGKAWYQTIKKPNWNPPNWLFAPAWTVLYTGMGYASYMVYEECGGFTEEAMLPLALYSGQLLLNWTWTPIFFRMHKIRASLIHILVLDMAAAACAVSFYKVNPNTVFLMTPYLCWLAFATCLNHTIWELNKDEKKEKTHVTFDPILVTAPPELYLDTDIF